MPSPYGVGSAPATVFLELLSLGIEASHLPGRYSANQTIPSESISIRRGKDFGVGGVHIDTFCVFQSTMPIWAVVQSREPDIAVLVFLYVVRAWTLSNRVYFLVSGSKRVRGYPDDHTFPSRIEAQRVFGSSVHRHLAGVELLLILGNLLRGGIPLRDLVRTLLGEPHGTIGRRAQRSEQSRFRFGNLRNPSFRPVLGSSRVILLAMPKLGIQMLPFLSGAALNGMRLGPGMSYSTYLIFMASG